MSPEALREELPAFYRLGTLADMSRMAAKLALARKAVVEIRRIEDYLTAHGASDNDLKAAMKETAEYAIVVADAMKDAVVILKRVKTNVESYQEKVHDASY